MPQAPTDWKNFASLIKVIEDLRGPNGCPWDIEQTHQSLARYAIEETAELVEAIETKSPTEICEELGDVLLQVVLHSEIARQAGHFDITNVIESINRKMVDRHPHVFKSSGGLSEGPAEAADVAVEWQKQKKKASTADLPLSHGIAPQLPALLTSQKIGERTKAYNFDWAEVKSVIAKVEEELAEVQATIESKDKVEQEKEIGDLLFSVAQLARHLNIDSEQALRKANRKFEVRFVNMTKLIQRDGLEFETLATDELEKYWQLAKSKEVKK